MFVNYNIYNKMKINSLIPLMSDDQDFRAMAAEREEEAAQLSDIEVYSTIVSNILAQDMPIDFCIDMLKEAIDDTNLIRDCIDHGVKNNTISSEKAEEAKKLL
jgi:hypothetical protein